MNDKENMPIGMQALQILIQKIRKGCFTAGQPLKETVIAKEENLNRNAVREALNQLVGLGIVEYRAFRGYRIKNFTLQDKLEWYELREAIEPIAARKLAKRQDKNVIAALELILQQQEEAFADKNKNLVNYSDLMFHLTIIRHCGNDTFIRQHNDLYVSTLFMLTSPIASNDHFQAANFYRYTEEENDEQTLRVHKEILRLIKQGDAREAEVLSRMHAQTSVSTLEKIIDLMDAKKVDLKQEIINFEEKLMQSNISAMKAKL